MDDQQKINPENRAAEIIADAEKKAKEVNRGESIAWRRAQWVALITAISGVSILGIVYGAGSFVQKASAAQSSIEEIERHDEIQDKQIEAKASKRDIAALRADIKELRTDIKILLQRTAKQNQ